MIRERLHDIHERLRGLSLMRLPNIGKLKLTKRQSLAIGLILRMFAGIMFGSARIFGAYSPFGVAYIAACGAGFEGVFALLGVVLGAIGTGGVDWALKYTANGVLVYAANAIFRDLPVYDKSWFSPVAAAVMTACTGFVYAAKSEWALSATAYYICEVMLAAGCAYFYRKALEPYLENTSTESNRKRRYNSAEHAAQYRVSALILIATLMVPLSRLRVMGVIAPGGIAAVIAVMAAAYKGGMAWGCATGVVFGIAVDAANGGSPFFTASYALAGLVAGVFRKQSRLSFLTVYTLANAVSAMWNWSSPMREASLYEVFVADVVFMLLPSKLLRTWKERFLPREERISAVSFAASYARKRAESVAQAFREIHEMLKRGVEGGRNDGDVISVFDVAADSVCRHCRRSAMCWQQLYEDTVDALNEAAPKMSARGELIPDDLPERFRNQCSELKPFIFSANSELRAMLLRRQYRNRIDERRDALFEQFNDMSAVLDLVADAIPQSNHSERALEAESRVNLYLMGTGVESRCAAFSDSNRRLHLEVSGEGNADLTKQPEWLKKLAAAAECPLSTADASSNAMHLLETEPLVATIGVASLRKRGEDVSGDNGAFFKTDEGMLYMILSDGMGSGNEAAKDSKAAVKILERFLRAGVDTQTSLKILSAVMNMRGEETIGCATVDLLCVNLFTGDTEFYKYGAAPSYVRKGAAVRRVGGESFSAGLGAAAPARTKLYLEPGAYAVIVSDGVAGTSDDWLSAYLAGYEYDGADFAKVLAHSIVEIASEKYGRMDDMTALVAALR
ncbi:MAG: SpoIIE family protein phosphatase [Oscillospiraceae bacterium]|jgi:stage II sporulation protein E|nr:SpoIIE family protein phosphatase [Oscillospiraceae bacterium]